MTRVFNFSAGPAALPESVLRIAADEMLDWHGSRHVGDGDEPPRQGVHRHRRRGREPAARAAGGAGELQGAVHAGRRDRRERDRADEPAARHDRADYIDTGEWSKKSIKEARSYCRSTSPRAPRRAATRRVPPQAEWQLDPKAAYVHICTNETIGGVEYHWTPDAGKVPLVADMSSNILSRPIDVARYGLIYAGAQKNIGPAGLTIVIVRDDLIGQALPITPSAFDYKQLAENDSMLQHAADLRDLHRRPGVPLDQGAGRPGRHGSAQPRQGRAALRLPRLDRLLLEPGRAARTAR